MPRNVANKMAMAPALSAAKALTGLSLVMPIPIVLMTFQPPDMVPRAMVAAKARPIHRGISLSWGMAKTLYLALKYTMAMMPMVFWASLAP